LLLGRKTIKSSNFHNGLFSADVILCNPSYEAVLVADILITLQATYQVTKTDLTSGSYQFQIAPRFHNHYRVFGKQERLQFSKLLMGDPLAPSIMQKFIQTVAAVLHQRHNVSMVAYLHDYLIFRPNISAPDILHILALMSITINRAKSELQPTSLLVYLGLNLSTRLQTSESTKQCIDYLLQLLALVLQASPQDVLRIMGYVTWLAWVLNCLVFITTALYNCHTYQMRSFTQHGLLQLPCLLWPPLQSRQIFSNATPNSTAGIDFRPLQRSFSFTLHDWLPTAEAEMAATCHMLLTGHQITTNNPPHLHVYTLHTYIVNQVKIKSYL
jgi:hypothetical protein